LIYLTFLTLAVGALIYVNFFGNLLGAVIIDFLELVCPNNNIVNFRFRNFISLSSLLVELLLQHLLVEASFLTLMVGFSGQDPSFESVDPSEGFVGDLIQGRYSFVVPLKVQLHFGLENLERLHLGDLITDVHVSRVCSRLSDLR